MLSRVADSLYWMSRYFERAQNGARVLEATYNLILNPAKFSTEQRWYRALRWLVPQQGGAEQDPQRMMKRLASEADDRASILSCVACARENARQVREEISSEMWEYLNRLYHRLLQSGQQLDDEAGAMRLLAEVRGASYRFQGITDLTMHHGEGWHFIQLGTYSERAPNLSLLLDAYFSTDAPADDLDWVGLLASCNAFEPFCKTYTADLKPERVAEFILYHPDFPYSLRYSVEGMHSALGSIMNLSSGRNVEKIDRLIGRLRASLAYGQITEVMAGGIHKYVRDIVDQCRGVHAAVHEAFIDYPIEVAFES
jgi:uncharacterized alpha-E superfamily protein